MYERVTKACELMLNTIDFVHEMNFFLFPPPLFTCLRPLLGFFSKYNLFTRFDRTKPLTIHEKKKHQQFHNKTISNYFIFDKTIASLPVLFLLSLCNFIRRAK